MYLSKRQSDNSRLLSTVERDNFIINFLKGYVDNAAIQKLVSYIAEKYLCSESEAEEVAMSILRNQREKNKGTLTSRAAQKAISIPPTTDNPVGRSVPLKEKDPEEEELQSTVPPKDTDLSIDPTPANTKTQKLEDVSKPIVKDPQENRQQAIIDALQAHKVSGQEFIKAMYGVEFTEESLGKYMSKCIEAASSIMATQTSNTVKSLVSPLIGES